MFAPRALDMAPSSVPFTTRSRRGHSFRRAFDASFDLHQCAGYLEPPNFSDLRTRPILAPARAGAFFRAPDDGLRP